jgi:hypothetical protein
MLICRKIYINESKNGDFIKIEDNEGIGEQMNLSLRIGKPFE